MSTALITPDYVNSLRLINLVNNLKNHVESLGDISIISIVSEVEKIINDQSTVLNGFTTNILNDLISKTTSINNHTTTKTSEITTNVNSKYTLINTLVNEIKTMLLEAAMQEADFDYIGYEKPNGLVFESHKLGSTNTSEDKDAIIYSILNNIYTPSNYLWGGSLSTLEAPALSVTGKGVFHGVYVTSISQSLSQDFSLHVIIDGITIAKTMSFTDGFRHFMGTLNRNILFKNSLIIHTNGLNLQPRFSYKLI